MNDSDPATDWPALNACPMAAAWLTVQAQLGLAPRTIDAYGRALADYISVCERDGVEPLSADRIDIAHYVHDLASRPRQRGSNVVSIDSGPG